MKKIFTFAAAVLASFSLWAATESNPTSASKDTDVAGTSYTIPGTYIASAGSAKTGAMPDKGIKFRLNKPAGDLNNAIEFKVNEGYVINAIQLVGVTNSDNKAATVGSIYVDGVAWNGTFNGALPAKNAEAASDIQVSGIAAAQSVVFVFSDLGGASQGNICYIVTYEEAVQKEVDHVDVTLGGVAVNGEALSDTQMATLYGALTLNLAAEYVEAPTVTFTVQTDTYYVGETEPSTKSEKIDVVAALNPDGKWQAQQTVGEKTYTITAVKPATVTITYMDGETVLGEEIVKVGETSTKHAEFETQPLANFEGWFKNSNFTSQIDIATYAINEDQTLYGKFVKAYAQSIDFEQMVLNNGKSYDVKSALTAAFYDYKNIDALDSLNNSKGAARNEPYLGLKIKKQGGYLACNVQPGTTIRIKFGYVAETILAIAGGDTIELTPTDNKLADMEFPIMVETLVKLQTTSDKTVVIKQIMVNDPLVTWMYPITYAAAENGKVEGWTIAFPNEKVNLTVTPDSAYHVVSVTAGNEVLLPDTASNYSFAMPGQATTVSATFAADEPIIPTLYTVTLGTYEHGTIAIIEPNEDNKYAEGAEVRLSVTPDEGYELEAISLEGIDLAIIVEGNTAKFVMPKQNVTVLATFKVAAPQPTLYTVTLGTYEHGTVAIIEPNAENKYAEGAEVRLSVTPDEGYELEAISLEGIDLAISVVDGVATFNMPAQDVVVLATFKEKTEGFENTQAGTKAVKVMRDGKLFIEKNGVLYNAQGVIVK